MKTVLLTAFIKGLITAAFHILKVISASYY